MSANAAKLMAKACEMFVLELTMRSYQAKLDATDGILKVRCGSGSVSFVCSTLFHICRFFFCFDRKKTF